MSKTDLDQLKGFFKQEIKSALEENNKFLFQYMNQFATKQDIARIYVTQEQHRLDINELQKIMDKLYGVVKRWDDERLLFSNKIKNHDSRLTKIETHLFAN